MGLHCKFVWITDSLDSQRIMNRDHRESGMNNWLQSKLKGKKEENVLDVTSSMSSLSLLNTASGMIYNETEDNINLIIQKTTVLESNQDDNDPNSYVFGETDGIIYSVTHGDWK